VRTRSDIVANLQIKKIVSNNYKMRNSKKLQQKNKIIPGQKSSNMEVYHPRKMHKKKNLKDYIFEFIMLFIAISCGFLTENLRENMSEHHKEKEYIVGLIGDIKEDTTTIRSFLSANKMQIIGIDSLMNLLEKPLSGIQYNKFIELTAKYLNNYNGFTPHDLTMTQMKNSAELRLIKNNFISNKIVNYYLTIDYFHELNVKMNYRYIEDTYKLELQFLDFSPKMNNKKLTGTDKVKIKELYNRGFGLKSAIEWDNHWLSDVYNLGAGLIEYLEKEYSIDQ
jgi:hypothetical protein